MLRAVGQALVDGFQLPRGRHGCVMACDVFSHRQARVSHPTVLQRRSEGQNIRWRTAVDACDDVRCTCSHETARQELERGSSSCLLATCFRSDDACRCRWSWKPSRRSRTLKCRYSDDESAVRSDGMVPAHGGSSRGEAKDAMRKMEMPVRENTSFSRDGSSAGMVRHVYGSSGVPIG